MQTILIIDDAFCGTLILNCETHYHIQSCKVTETLFFCSIVIAKYDVNFPY